MCQCPTSGFTHFYVKFSGNRLTATFCVNALHRALLISTDKKDEKGEEYINVCQCPTSGFTHFYKATETFEGKGTKVCQCPTSGFTHFYVEVLCDT